MAEGTLCDFQSYVIKSQEASTHSWSQEPPCKKSDHPEATMFKGSPSHLEKLCVGIIANSPS